MNSGQATSNISVVVDPTVKPLDPKTPQKKSIPVNTFRLQAKNLFLTYPRCTMEKELVRDNLKGYFKENIKWFVIAREDHEDGTPHIHIVVSLKEKAHIRKQEDLDKITGSHGNYQAARNVMKCAKYAVKDQDYLEEGIDMKAMIQQELSEKPTKKLVSALMEGKTPKQIMREYPELYFNSRKKVEEFYSDLQLQLLEIKKPKIIGISEGEMLISGDMKKLVEWLKMNVVNQDLKERKPRMKHLYLRGEPGIGKSFLASQLRVLMRVYDLPHESWNDGYQDGCYDLIIMDEFNGQKTITEMNLITDGYVTPLKRRGMCPYLKKDALPVIIISNKAPEEVYHKADRVLVEAFASRYEVVHIFNKIDIRFEEERPEVPKNTLIVVNDTVTEEGGVILDSDTESDNDSIQKMYESD